MVLSTLFIEGLRSYAFSPGGVVVGVSFVDGPTSVPDDTEKVPLALGVGDTGYVVDCPRYN